MMDEFFFYNTIFFLDFFYLFLLYNLNIIFCIFHV